MFPVFIGRKPLETRHHQIHGHLQLVVLRSVVILELVDVARPRLPDQHRAIFIGGRPQFTHRIVYFRQFLVVLLVHVRPPEFVLSRKHWIVRKVRILVERIYRIQTEPRHAALVPKPRHIQHRLFHRGIPPVQVRLLRIKIMVVILIRLRIECPRWSPERREPIIRRLSRPFPVAPDVPVAVLRRSSKTSNR